MRKLLVIVCVFTLVLFSSCDLLLDILGDDSNSNSLGGSWYEGDPKFGNFWATNFRNDKEYRVDADSLYTGTYCDIWVEKGKGVDEAKAEEVGKHFDEKIYSEMIKNFSLRNIKDGEAEYDNVMEVAGVLSENCNGKLCILLLDIKDDYNLDKGNYSFVAGYFWAGNFLITNGSNERDMIYIDIYPGLDEKNIKETYRTLAHEMQHLMNFVTTLLIRSELNQQGQITSLNLMDTWIDEGLASAAEWVYSGEYSQERIDWYNHNGFKLDASDPIYKNTRGLINKGNTFFVWNNRSKESQYAVMDDYATVNIFFQWLRLQSNNNIYKNIITSEYSDYQAVTSAFNNAKSTSYSWDSLLSTWLAANFIHAPSGLYGYNDKLDIKVPGAPSISPLISLAPGEGVYSKADINPNFSNGTNIRYAYLSSSTLLTYNANTMINGSSERGSTTGIPVYASVETVSSARSAAHMGMGMRPYRIDAGEMLKKKPLDSEQLKRFRNINKAENE